MKSLYFLKIFIISFVITFSVFGQTKIITTGDEWQYYDNESAPLESWKEYTSSTDHWKKGISPLGYGHNIVKTNISFGDNSKDKYITSYFKKTFVIRDPYDYFIYRLNVQRDDGIVVYLNGNEVMRDNMPEGVITHSSTASALIFSSSKEKKIHTLLLPPDSFINGVNTISASVHQARKTSSDCIFNLELVGDNRLEMIPLLLKQQTIKNLNLDIKLKNVNHNLELEKKIFQIKHLEESKSILKTSLLATSISLLLSIGGLLYLWVTFTSKEKKLKESNQNKNQEMVNISLSLLNNQLFLKELKKDIESYFKDDATIIKKNLKRTMTRIEYNLDHEHEWQNLKNYFNSVHTGYIDKLVKLHPSLTDIELRHCVFIKLHMQTKEIANVLHIDPKSVQASRYRLKKKMNLNESIHLKEYLLSI